MGLLTYRWSVTETPLIRKIKEINQGIPGGMPHSPDYQCRAWITWWSKGILWHALLKKRKGLRRGAHKAFSCGPAVLGSPTHPPAL